MQKYVCVILLVVIPGMVESARTDADPSVLNSQKSGRLERPSLAKSPLTVIIMGDAEELLHLNKQVNHIEVPHRYSQVSAAPSD